MNTTKKYTVNPYIGFDDRWFIIAGIPVITLFASLIFSELPASEFFDKFWLYYPEGLTFTSAYWVFNRFLLTRLRKRLPRWNQTFLRNVLQIAIAFICYPIISLAVHYSLVLALRAYGLTSGNEGGSFVGVLATYFLTFMILSIYEAVYFFQQYKQAIVGQEKLRSEHLNTQLVSLRNQVNPHFLFNSLNTLMSLIPREAEHAHQYLNKLSNFYRYSVSESEDLLVPLEKEMENLRNYIDLIKERFGAGLDVHLDVPNDLTAQVLPMSLQLLVENAVKHNIVSREDPLHLHVYVSDDHIHVENSIQPRITETESTGMGLKNIKQRYHYVTEKKILVIEEHSLFKVSLPLIHRYK